jgi:hypothetical protein
MDHPLRPLARHQRGQPSGVGHVETLEAEGGVAAELRDAIELEPRRVVVVDVVDAEHFVTARQQPLADMHADESGCAGDEDLHDVARAGPRPMPV